MVVDSDFQAPKSAGTVVGEGFWIPMNTEPHRFAYIYTKLEISTPFKSDLRFPSPPTTQNPPPFQLLIDIENKLLYDIVNEN